MKRLFHWLLLCPFAFSQGAVVFPHTVVLPHTVVFPGASGGGGGTVAYLNTNTPFQVTAASYSGSATVNTGGTNVVAFFPVCYDGTTGLSVTSISFNSVSILSNTAGAAVNDTTSNVYCQTFYYINPPTGSHTLAISVTGATEIYGNAVAFQGVNQTTPVRSGTYTSCTPTTGASCGGVIYHPALVITSNSNDLTFSCIETGDSGSVTSTSQTSDGINNNGTNGIGSDHATTAGASITSTWTITEAAYALLGFSIQHS
jgi:hypothetical protein